MIILTPARYTGPPRRFTMVDTEWASGPHGECKPHYLGTFTFADLRDIQRQILAFERLFGDEEKEKVNHVHASSLLYGR